MRAIEVHHKKNNSGRTFAEVTQAKDLTGKDLAQPFENEPSFLIQRKCACGGECPSCKFDEEIQAKLTISEPGDKYEHEAERVAEQVMRMTDDEVLSLSQTETKIQRKFTECSSGGSLCPECAGEEEGVQLKPLDSTITPIVQRQIENEIEEDEEEELVQTKVVSGKNPETISNLGSQIQALRGGGQPLPKSVLNYFQPRFGYDFSRVKIHNDNLAFESAKSINSRAYTSGNHIVFGQGQYEPETEAGKNLLAHELAHVLQQSKTTFSINSTHLQTIQRHHAGVAAPTGVTRNTFRGCNDDQNFFVDLASSRAPNWVGSAITELQNILTSQTTSTPSLGTISTTEGALNQFFHPPRGRTDTMATLGSLHHRPETIRTIITRLTRMKRTLENPRLFICVSRATCIREQSADTLAYAGPGTVISVCPIFFDLSLTEQISTLVHESAHQIGLMRNVIGRHQIVNLTLNQALTNADSYALFVIENFIGPPTNAPFRQRPLSLTPDWGSAHWFTEFLITEPIRGLFYFGRGRSRYPSDQYPTIASPFPTNRPILFRGQVRYYVDTAQLPIPPFEPMPWIQAQLLYTDLQSQRTREVLFGNDPLPGYVGPGRPLETSFSTDFDSTITENGTLSIALVMASAPGQLELLYDDVINFQPNSGI